MRICVALAGTVVAGVLGLAAALVGVGRHLEDACTTEPPASFAPELTVLRGPVRHTEKAPSGTFREGLLSLGWT